MKSGRSAIDPSAGRERTLVTLACRVGRRQDRRATLTHAGFTLVEILAALLMMAIVIPVAMEGMSIATRAGVLGQRKAAAMRVAESVLDDQIAEGNTQRSTDSGTTADGDTNYDWTMKSETWTQDQMTQVTVTVSFTVQGGQYSVDLSTLISQPATDVAANPTSG